MPTKLTLTLPDILGGKATLVIERNDLATVATFDYDHEDDVMTAIRDAQRHLGIVEANPPAMPPPAPLPAPLPASKSSAPAPKAKKNSGKSKSEPAKPAEPVEPTYTLKLKWNTGRPIPQTLLRFPEGSEQVAIDIASRLFEVGVWDLKRAIVIEDPAATLKKMSLYTDKQLKGLFDVTDFAQYTETLALETV